MRKETEMIIECADAEKAVGIFFEEHPEVIKWREILEKMARTGNEIDDDRKKNGRFNPEWTHFITLEVYNNQTLIYIGEHVEVEPTVD